VQVGPGVIIGGKYQMERPLARGGMGAVWVARHVKLGSSVAVKLLDAHLAESSQSVARFEREARSAANLDTPHVVHVHDYGVEAGTPYLVMELLRGEDLNTRLRKRRRLTLQEAAKIVTQMGRALRRAHEAGIIHRDLKPANVFLARVDDDEIVKILDFGIAKETWSRVEESTKTGEVFGSPHYMSPEQARAQKDVDHRADLWATGVIAYRLITGKLPFPGEVLGEVLSSVLVDPFPPIAEVAPDLPAGLEAFFAKALAKKKEQRFANVAELVEAFNAIAAAAPAQVLPPEDDPTTGPTLDPVRPPALSAPSQLGIQAVTPRDHGAAGATTAMLAQGKLPSPPAAIADTASLTVPLARPSASGEPAPLAPSDIPSSPSGTGPSLASSSSSLLPPGLRPRRAPVVWIAGAAAVCVVLVVVLAVIGQGTSDGQPAAGAESTTATATTPGLDPKGEKPPSVSPAGPAGSANPLLAAPPTSPTATASSGAGPASSVAAPVKIPPSAKTAPTSTTAPRTSATPGATTGGTPGKKPRDWGL